MGLFGAVERAPGSQISASEGAGDLGHRRTAGCRERMRDAVCIDDRDAVLSEALRNHRFTAANPAVEASSAMEGKAIQPNHAPSAASSLKSPCPMPSLFRTRRNSQAISQSDR